MPADYESYAGSLVADVILHHLKAPRKPLFGLFVENLPPFSVLVCCQRLAAGATELPAFRLSILGLPAGAERELPLKRLKPIEITFSPETANEWRNDQAAGRGTPQVVVVLGPVRKVNSLRTTYLNIGPEEMRAAVAERSVRLHPSPERKTFWTAVVSRTEFSLPGILEFAAEIAALYERGKVAGLKHSEPTHLDLLGLIPQPSLLETTGPRQIGQLLRKNRELRERLRDLRSRDRSKLLGAVERGGPDKRVAEVALAYAKTGSRHLLRDLSYASVMRLLSAKSVHPATGDEEEGTRGELTPARDRAPRRLPDDLALDALVKDGGPDAERLLKDVKGVLSEDSERDHVSVGEALFRPRPRSGQSEVLTACASLITEQHWGGLIRAPGATDILLALRALSAGDAATAVFVPAEEGWPEEMIKRAVREGFSKSVALEAWTAFHQTRATLLEYLSDLTDFPLLAVAGSVPLRTTIDQALEGYHQLLKHIEQVVEQLRKSGSFEASRRLTARFLALDLIFLRTQAGIQAICGPTHPFHLWHWRTLYQLVEEGRGKFATQEVDALREAVRLPLPTTPHVVLSPFAVPGVDRARPLVANGRLGALPVFAEPAAQLRGTDGTGALGDLLDRFLRLQPHAARGLRVTLVDPPSVAEAVERLIILENVLAGAERTPVHLHVVRSRPAPEASEQEQNSLDETRVELEQSGGSLSVDESQRDLTELAARLRRHPSHVTAVFDPGIGQDIMVDVVDPPALNPVVLPRAYKYDQFDDRIDSVPAGEGGSFDVYHALFCDLIDRPKTDFVGRRSGAAGQTQQLEALAKESGWLVVLDRGLEPTLQVRSSIRLETRAEGSRDIATFTAHPESIEELAADMTRTAGLVPDSATSRRVLEELFSLGGESALAMLRPQGNGGLVDPKRAKGVVGLLKAARWYRENFPDALLMSLDSSKSRLWVVGDEEARRADLLAIRQTMEGLRIDVVEVKTHAAPAGQARVVGGRIEGPAVRQIEVTIQTLGRVLAAKGAATLDGARREILRDHLYRSVAARSMTRDQRKHSVGMLEELFEKGQAQCGGLVAFVHVGNGGSPMDPVVPPFHDSPEHYPVGVVELFERGAPTPRAKSPSVSTTSRGSEEGEDSTRDQTATAKPAKETQAPTGSPGAAVPRATTESGDQERTIRPRVLIGLDLTSGEVWWDPNREGAGLENFGFQVSGVAGSGKTQLVRSLIHGIAAVGLPVLIFDFKNDYSDSHFAASNGLNVYDVARRGLPFNPLAVVPDEHGMVRPGFIVFEIAAMLRRIFNLGEQQEASLKNAMKAAFKNRGIPDSARPIKVADLPSAPGFGEVIELLRHDRSSQLLLNRVEPLFDLGLFPDSAAAEATFSELLTKRVVLGLFGLPGDKIQAAIAEFLILRMHGVLLKGDQPRRLTRLVVLDEAHRVAQSEKLGGLAREGRAFGVGLVVATQFAKDVPNPISGNLATKVFLRPSAEDAKTIAQTITGNAHGKEAQRVIELALGLESFQGIFRNQHYQPYVLVQVIPYYQRMAQTGL